MYPYAPRASALALALAACTTPQLAVPCSVREGGTREEREADVAACSATLFDVPWNQPLQKDVDILFVIDNSPSMAPKQAALAQSIPRFIEKIEATGASYHVGVVTSDVGTHVAPGQPWSIPVGACDSFAGDDGTLQRVPCSARSGVSSGAKDACRTLCPDPRFVPKDGQGFVSRLYGKTNVPREIVAGKDVGPQRAFQCMALVGDGGCGVEAPLEAARRALDGHNPMNKDFLRPGSVLAIIFITDEDDCSVAPGRRAENDPVTMDCVAPNKDAPAACFSPDFRCLARAVECDEPLNTPGGKSNCRERQGSYLEKIENYVRFFSSLRPENKVLISGIWTLPRLDGGGKLVVEQLAGTSRTDGLNRGGGADAGCVSAADAGFFGRPQLRLSKFARQFKDSRQIDVCAPDTYPQALDAVAAAIRIKLVESCLPLVPRTQDGTPLCFVGDVDRWPPGAAPEEFFPVCGSACCSAWAGALQATAEDPVIRAACAAEEAQACFCALESQVGACRGGAVFGVWRRGGAEGPADKHTSIRCAAR